MITKTEEEVLESIILLDGDCVTAAMCLECPFSNFCVSRAILDGVMLNKEERVNRAYDMLFNEFIEEVLDDSEEKEE